MPPQTLQRPSSSSSLEHELVRVRDALSFRESEESWDTIAKGLETFATIARRESTVAPQEVLQALHTLAHPINSAVLSDRSRLSAAATNLLNTAAAELGPSFESLIPLFFPTLLTMCTRTNKVFVSRARACVIAIIDATQSPIILSHLARSAKDKSATLRLTVAECALSCLNTFNPPDLQKEARSRDIELLIKCAATDANGDIRKFGRKMYDAYKVLLPERVDSFTAPLTPTIRKYLNIVPQQPHYSQSNPTSRPASSFSTRSVLNASSSSAPSSSHGDSYYGRNPSGAATHEDFLTRPSSSASTSQLEENARIACTSSSQSSRIRIAPSRPASVAGQSSQHVLQPKRSGMPPPDFIPSRSQRGNAQFNTIPVRPATTRDDGNAGHNSTQRQKIGPLRPSQGHAAGQTAPTSGAPVDVTGAKRLGGARRVPLPEPPPEKKQDDRRTAKGPARPPTSCELSDSSVHDNEAKHDMHSSVKKPDAQNTKVVPTAPGTKNLSTGTAGKRSKDPAPQHVAHPAGRSKQPVLSQPAATKKPATGKQQDRKDRPKGTVSQPSSKNIVTRRRVPDKSQYPTIPHSARQPAGKKKDRPASNNEMATSVDVVRAVSVPLPPSPTPDDHAPNAISEGDTPRASNARTAPSTPPIMIDPVTPKAVPLSTPLIHVEQTPISALVESIHRGFVFTPRTLESTFEEEDEEDNERTFITENSEFPMTSPLSWRPLLFRSNGTREDKVVDPS